MAEQLIAQEFALHQGASCLGTGALVQVLLEDRQPLSPVRQHPRLHAAQDEGRRVQLREDPGLRLRGPLRQPRHHLLLRPLLGRELLQTRDEERLLDAHATARAKGHAGLAPVAQPREGAGESREVLLRQHQEQQAHRAHHRLFGDRGAEHRHLPLHRRGPLLPGDPQPLGQ